MSDATRARDALEAIDDFTASIPDRDTTTNGAAVPLTKARGDIGDLVRAAAIRHERTAITDHGERAALIVHPQDWDNLVDALATATAALTVISGQRAESVSQEDAERAIFGGAVA